MTFEWDQQKAQSNLVKHGISFKEAQTVFDDPLYVDFYDPDHSQNENRYIRPVRNIISSLKCLRHK